MSAIFRQLQKLAENAGRLSVKIRQFFRVEFRSSRILAEKSSRKIVRNSRVSFTKIALFSRVPRKMINFKIVRFDYTLEKFVKNSKSVLWVKNIANSFVLFSIPLNFATYCVIKMSCRENNLFQSNWLKMSRKLAKSMALPPKIDTWSRGIIFNC